MPVDSAPATVHDETSGTFDALSLSVVGVGTVIGAGIFVVTGQAAALFAGPAIVVSFAIAGVVCLLSGLCYAEMASMFPRAGAAYSFTTEAFGRLPGWGIGWALVAEYLFATAAIGIGWSAYMQGVIGEAGVHLPAVWASSPLRLDGATLRPTGAWLNLPAMAIILAVTASHLAGLHRSLRLNQVIVAIKLSAVALFVGFGLAHAQPAHWHPFVPPVERRPDGSSAYGWGGIVRAAGVVFYAYLGFEALASAARETRDPRRAIPIALLTTLGVASLLYGLAGLAMTGLADFHTLDSDAPIATALAAAGAALAWLRTYVGVAVTVGLWAALWPAIFAMSRLLMALGEDRHLSIRLAALHPRRRVPSAALLVAGGAGALVAGVLPVALLAELISAGTLLAFAAVSASVIRLRLRQPERVRGFSVPVWPITATLAIAASLFLLWGLGTAALLRIAAWQAIGFAVLAIVRWRGGGR